MDSFSSENVKCLLSHSWPNSNYSLLATQASWRQATMPSLKENTTNDAWSTSQYTHSIQQLTLHLLVMSFLAPNAATASVTSKERYTSLDVAENSSQCTKNQGRPQRWFKSCGNGEGPICHVNHFPHCYDKSGSGSSSCCYPPRSNPRSQLEINIVNLQMISTSHVTFTYRSWLWCTTSVKQLDEKGQRRVQNELSDETNIRSETRREPLRHYTRKSSHTRVIPGGRLPGGSTERKWAYTSQTRLCRHRVPETRYHRTGEISDSSPPVHKRHTVLDNVASCLLDGDL